MKPECPTCGSPRGFPPAGPCDDPYHETHRKRPPTPRRERHTLVLSYAAMALSLVAILVVLWPA